MYGWIGKFTIGRLTSWRHLHELALVPSETDQSCKPDGKRRSMLEPSDNISTRPTLVWSVGGYERTVEFIVLGHEGQVR